MKRTKAIDTLNEKVRLLEIEQTRLQIELKESAEEVMDNLKPANFIKNIFKPVVSNPEIKETVIDTAIGLATGFLTKKVLFGTVHNPLMKIAASLLQAGVTSLVSTHPDPIKNAGSALIKRFFSKKQKDEEIGKIEKSEDIKQ